MSAITSSDLHIVLGAGPAGSTLAGELARRGHAVRLVDRSGSGSAPEGVTRVRGDVGTLDGARSVIKGAAVVYHCVNVAYHLQVDVMPGIQDAVLGAVEAEGARLVVLDTLYPYGETQGRVMTEDTAWRATGQKGRMRAALDEKYLAAHQRGRARVVLGRSADFVGPQVLNSTLGGAVFPGALTGGEVYGLGDIDLPHSYTDIRNAAAGLATLGEHPDGDGRVWHLPTAPALTTREVFRLIERKVGQPLNTVIKQEPVPFGPFDQVFMDSYAELFYQHTEPQVMDSSAIQETFGLKPIDLDATLDDTIAWYRDFLAAQR
ncbi:MULTISPECIES: NAD-dependent epimerase/dehydratase family protein [Streptomyces]|uniref:Epimerase n=1 Tax=Streptomyces venezuelae TaxID=54571 RepID=A0A5P2BPK0_STRVZ|nr:MULTISPECIES: NAD-dependent epimerase/dehydratase family protein [Streptomyces]NEA00108.1 NAD-dependent epimerase/dehydratase family protein [Streptomyces sp. SID10116]MYY79867.1 NAD-dependent epimerase/dehydratase family protein [Streptomyces sp. SID335]MYZ14966.1 NAD-dependent epimerase/dehydratase family protein [Streptomyces sp. SID337]NDZ87471.1 NAD-dependent epimerase/dehydratase family protein [Streptomyces sp. SID10115]NEB43362.1 NAD-dependent epimerase/dehydratase family protein [S